MYQLLRPYHFRVGQRWFEIPAQYLYDGASVPRGAWYSTYSPFDPLVMAAALCHDYLCDTRPAEVTSEQAADDFHRRLLEHGAGKMRAWLMWRAVRMFGPRW